VSPSTKRRLAPLALALAALAVALVSGHAVTRGYARAEALRTHQVALLDARGRAMRSGDPARRDAAWRSLTAAARREGASAEAASHQAGLSATYVFLAAALAIGLLLASLQRSRRVGAVQAARSRTAHDSERWFRELVQNSSDVVLVVDSASMVRYATPSCERMLGVTADALAGRSLADLADPEDRQIVLTTCATADADSPRRAQDWRLRREGGGDVAVEAVAARLATARDGADVAVTLHDISERKAFEEQLRHRAFHDELTGLANRPLFEDRTVQALARARRSGQTVAVVFLDLDDFKVVNDALGHAAGDELLREAAGRLGEGLRVSDTPARLGGDEFAVLLDGVSDPAEAERVAERIVERLREPFLIGGREHVVRASVGIAIAANGQRSAADLLRDSDAAMYEAKRQGKGRTVRFEPHMHASAIQRLTLRTDLERAVAQGELELHYQPVVGLVSGEIGQVEALVRWRHPERGFLAPVEFIPLAEETGLIVQLGRWVLREACEQARRWLDDEATGAPAVAVNVSARQLGDPSFLDDVASILADTGLPANRLVIEITEHTVMGDIELVAPRLEALRAMGIEIALDDFGTGYSSLAYLRQFAIDTLKIDRAFVAALDASGTDHALVRSITVLAQTLGMRVVAEGIEESRQLDVLRELDCELGQGWLFSRAVPADEATALLRRRRLSPEPA
jgi:diguanylate cyclase (GGDEF)-like protein/PAS domain S-box-containing protein